MVVHFAYVEPQALSESRIFHHYVLCKLLAFALNHDKEENQEIDLQGFHRRCQKNGKTYDVD